jgi:hypothetical protein
MERGEVTAAEDLPTIDVTESAGEEIAPENPRAEAIAADCGGCALLALGMCGGKNLDGSCGRDARLEMKDTPDQRTSKPPTIEDQLNDPTTNIVLAPPKTTKAVEASQLNLPENEAPLPSKIPYTPPQTTQKTESKTEKSSPPKTHETPQPNQLPQPVASSQSVKPTGEQPQQPLLSKVQKINDSPEKILQFPAHNAAPEPSSQPKVVAKYTSPDPESAKPKATGLSNNPDVTTPATTQETIAAPEFVRPSTTMPTIQTETEQQPLDPTLAKITKSSFNPRPNLPPRSARFHGTFPRTEHRQPTQEPLLPTEKNDSEPKNPLPLDSTQSRQSKVLQAQKITKNNDTMSPPQAPIEDFTIPPIVSPPPEEQPAKTYSLELAVPPSEITTKPSSLLQPENPPNFVSQSNQPQPEPSPFLSSTSEKIIQPELLTSLPKTGERPSAFTRTFETVHPPKSNQKHLPEESQSTVLTESEDKAPIAKRQPSDKEIPSRKPARKALTFFSKLLQNPEDSVAQTHQEKVAIPIATSSADTTPSEQSTYSTENSSQPEQNTTKLSNVTLALQPDDRYLISVFLIAFLLLLRQTPPLPAK